MDISKLIKDLNFKVVQSDTQISESGNQIAFTYELTLPGKINLTPYMSEMDFKEIQSDYDLDEDLWFDQFDKEFEKEFQRHLNKIELFDNSLGYSVEHVSLKAPSIKEASIEVQVNAYFEVPESELFEGLKQGLSNLGK